MQTAPLRPGKNAERGAGAAEGTALLGAECERAHSCCALPTCLEHTTIKAKRFTLVTASAPFLACIQPIATEAKVGTCVQHLKLGAHIPVRSSCGLTQTGGAQPTTRAACWQAKGGSGKGFAARPFG